MLTINDILPVEVKSEANTSSKSLKKFKELFPDKVKLRVRFSLDNLKLDDDVLNIPLIFADRADRLPDSLTSIGSSAFYSCYDLTDMVLPDSVASVGNCAFINCTSLTTVSVGSGMKNLDVTAFSNCSKLSAIYVSEDNSAYASVDGIVYNKEKTKLFIVPAGVSGEITIPKTVEEFTYQAVDSCKNLTAINVEDGHPNYKSVDGIVYTADGKTVLCCPRGKVGAVAVQEGAESIDERAFYQCDKLTDVTLTEFTRNS